MTEDNKIIRGSGGGGQPQQPPPPTKEPDTLNSKQFASFLDLISEGEIEGSATASKEGITDKTSLAYIHAYLKDTFLNDTPVLKANASSTAPQPTDFNYQNVSFVPRLGTANQTKINGIESSSSITPVGVTVTKASPVIRQIQDDTVDRVKVTITFPQLQKVTDTGDLLGSSVQLRISTQFNGGGFGIIIDDTITGRTPDAYQKDYSITLNDTFTTADIKVERVTDDATDASIIDKFQWTSFAEIIDDANTYPNSAYNYLRLDSQQFSAIPRRKYRIRGVKVRIPGAGASGSGTPSVDAAGRIVYPDNYIFNNVMGAAVWCSCPAMILLDLLTTERYGFGTHITDADLDLFSFVAASKFANTLVDDGFGGLEARFSCNVNIQASSEAFNLINELAGVMRCMPIWSTGSILLAQDSPKDPTFLFSLANVTSEGFTYSGSSLKQRHSIISVSYFNMDTQEIDFEVFENTDLKNKIGSVVKKVKGFGCTSRGQALRLAKAIAFAEANESEVCTFTTSIEGGLLVRPGSVIEISDPVRAGVRRSGRLKAVASAASMTIDDVENTDTPTINSPTLSVILPDGSVESRSISAINQDSGVVTLSSAFSQTPNVNTIYLIQNTIVQAQKFRVITVEEKDEVNYTISALSYVAGKYPFIEDGESLPNIAISVLNQPQQPPENLSAVEKIVPINNQAVSKIIVSWKPSPNATEYQFNYRYNNGNFITQKVSSPDFEIFNSQLGVYEFKVFTHNISGVASSTSTGITFNAVGKTALPQDPTGLTVEPISDQFIRLRFNPATDIDVTHGGAIQCRHTPNTGITATFSNSIDIVPKLSGNVSEIIVPALSGTYSIKFIDDGGRKSANAAKVITTQPQSFPAQVVLQEREDLDSPPFQGEKDHTFYDSDFDGLLLDGTLLIDNVGLIDNLANIDFAGPISKEGSYEFQNEIEMGGIFNLSLVRTFVTVGLLPNDLIDSRTEFIDTWTDFDGTLAEDVNANILVATTNLATNTSTAATYGQSGTTITITKANHGYQTGEQVVIDFTAGSAVDGNYVIQSVPSSSTFTVTSSTSATISAGTSCTYGPNFTQFNTFVNGEYIGRGFKFKVVLTSDDEAQNILVNQLGYQASLKSRTETINSSISSQCQTNNSAKTVTFTSPFFTGTGSLGGSTTAFIPTIGITLEGAVSGDYFTIPSISGTGFTIETRDVNNNFKNLNFKYTAIGFGKGQ